jgi:RNA polymerase sigma-70 factor (ECF subfamily)
MNPKVEMDQLLKYQRTVFLICLGFTRHPWDAQELSQECYLQAQERLQQLREPEAAKAWLCCLARNLCLDHLRRQKWRRWLQLEEVEEQKHNENPEALYESREQFQLMKRAIARLPAKLREVFILRAYGELSYDEIAHTLGLQPGTVMSRLSRARDRIRQSLEKEGGR